MDLYSSEVNRYDADGLPLLLMALNHDLRYVLLLLHYRADVHILDDFMEQGSNILHLLFQREVAPSTRAGTNPTFWTRGLASPGLAGTRGLASPVEELLSFKISPSLSRLT